MNLSKTNPQQSDVSGKDWPHTKFSGNWLRLFLRPSVVVSYSYVAPTAMTVAQG